MKAWKRITVLLLVALLSMALVLPVSAAEPEHCDYGMLAIGTEEDLQLYMAVCVAEEDGNYVYSGYHPIQQQEALYCSLTAALDTNSAYDLKEDISYDEVQGVYRFRLEEKLSAGSTADVFPKMTEVEKGDTVYFVRLNLEGSKSFPVEKTTVESVWDHQLTTEDRAEEEIASGDFAVIFNDNGAVVGFCKSGVATAPASGNTWSSLVYWIVGGVVVVAAVVIFLVARKKKHKKAAVQQEVSHTQVDDESTTLDSDTILGDFEVPMNNTLMLKCHGGALNGRIYPISAEGLTIGREPDNTIRYPGHTPGISRHHVRIFWQNGQLMLLDVGSSNGTFLNQSGRIVSMQPVPLNPGDVFYLGEKLNGFEIVVQ